MKLGLTPRQVNQYRRFAPTRLSSTTLRSIAMASGTQPISTRVPVAGEHSEFSFASLGVHHTQISQAPGVDLSSHQQVVVGSILDLFSGNPTLKHFRLWSPDATFSDPLTVSTGAKQYLAQWYGLPAVFDPIKIIRHQVTSAGNPIEMELENSYTVKGIQKKQDITSVVRIFVGPDGKIDKVEDRWNDKLPDGPISQAFRKLNAKTVPMVVKVPQTEEEDLQMQATRHE